MGAGTIDVRAVPCVCGRNVCGQRNRHYFPQLRADRVVVFLNRVDPAHTFWTWRPTRRGEPIDNGLDMGHYDTQQRAFEDAVRYTRGLPARQAVAA